MPQLTHLDRLEAESIHILREVAAECEKPVMLYSIGKDSAVMLHLALKAFYPSRPPFPMLHVDTGWKFREMIAFRDRKMKELGLELLVHTNLEGAADGVGPFTHGSAYHTDVMKTAALKQALDMYGFDAAFGGARRDEERARAKERVYSHRDSFGQWDPKNQRPELWGIYNGRYRPGEHFRVFPLSNWTELDIWTFIANEGIDLPEIYFAHRRPVFLRDGMLMAVTEFLPPDDGAHVAEEMVRFRTVGDATCTAAIASVARTVDEVIAETAVARVTERGATRADDRVSEAGMEDRKRQGYF